MQAREPDIAEAAVISLDGLVIEALWQVDGDHDQIGAMSAALIAVAKRAATVLERGALVQIAVDAAEGYVVLRTVGEDAILAVLTGHGVNLGMVFLVVARAAEQVAATLAS
jgi:predicted regulator of Ras-like GTPase activity (Roadblock/LC7/MglB family)